jgi:RNA polymerase sigma factor (sigma-70 family)
MRAMWQLLNHIRALGQPPLKGEDHALLQQFACARDSPERNAPFAELVRRHGPMVRRTCFQILGEHTEAEDAFQATFLVLAQQARSISRRSPLAAWLHGVARRTALKLFYQRKARKVRELKAQAKMPTEDTLAEVTRREDRAIIHEEIDSLPERYRAPFVLQHLAGLSAKEGAEQLGCTRATFSKNVQRGRELLAKRLTRRGIGVSGALALLSVAAIESSVNAERALELANVARLFAAGTGVGATSQGVKARRLLRPPLQPRDRQHAGPRTGLGRR